jgi:hypothetical protein
MDPVVIHRATNQTIAFACLMSEDLDLRGKGGPYALGLETRRGDWAVLILRSWFCLCLYRHGLRVFGHAQGGH